MPSTSRRTDKLAASLTALIVTQQATLDKSLHPADKTKTPTPAQAATFELEKQELCQLMDMAIRMNPELLRLYDYSRRTLSPKGLENDTNAENEKKAKWGSFFFRRQELLLPGIKVLPTLRDWLNRGKVRAKGVHVVLGILT